MFLRRSEIVTTGAVAIGRIEVLRMHAAGIYVAPAIGEFFDCKCLRNQTEVLFLGRQEDSKRAHLMLATIRSAMDREFADFLESRREGGEHPRALAASFAQGMGHRITERLRRLKSGRADIGLVRPKLLKRLLDRAIRHKQVNAAKARWAGIEAAGRVRLVLIAQVASATHD